LFAAAIAAAGVVGLSKEMNAAVGKESAVAHCLEIQLLSLMVQWWVQSQAHASFENPSVVAGGSTHCDRNKGIAERSNFAFEGAAGTGATGESAWDLNPICCCHLVAHQEFLRYED
jgi:hypothetical protein